MRDGGSNPPILYMAVYAKIKDRVADLPKDQPWQVLVHACCDKKLSLPEIAIKLGITKKALYNWINGVSEPKNDKERIINDILIEVKGYCD